MKNPLLFAMFSDVNPDGESLSDWADAYGRGDFIFAVYEPKDEREWRREHLDLSFAVMLWEMILKDDMRLNGIIGWNEDTNSAYVRPFPRD
jgi:outer membrane phospholipase A